MASLLIKNLVEVLMRYFLALLLTIFAVGTSYGQSTLSGTKGAQLGSVSVIENKVQDGDLTLKVNDGGVVKDAITIIGSTGATRSSHINGFTSNSVYTGNPTTNGNGVYKFTQFVSSGASASTGNLAVVGAATGQAAFFYVTAVCGGSSSSSVAHALARHDGTTGTITTAAVLLIGDAVNASIAWSGATLQFTLTSTFRACTVEVIGGGRGNDIRIDYP